MNKTQDELCQEVKMLRGNLEESNRQRDALEIAILEAGFTICEHPSGYGITEASMNVLRAKHWREVAEWMEQDGSAFLYSIANKIERGES